MSAMALAACGSKIGEGPLKPDIYSAQQPDGKVTTLNFHGDGTYLEFNRDTNRTEEEGNWTRRDGKLCMRAKGAPNDVCFEETAGPNDTILLNHQGQVFTLTVLRAPT